MEEQVRATVNAMAIEEGRPTGRIDTKLIEQAIELLKTEQTIDHPNRRRRSLPMNSSPTDWPEIACEPDCGRRASLW